MLAPIVNEGLLYVNNCNVARTGNATATIATGQVRDSTNTFDMNVGTLLSINAANTGLNGLDTGSLAASTFYAVFVIADPTEFQPVGALISLSATAPTMPFNYGIFRRVGWLLTDASSHFLPMWVSGDQSEKELMWDSPIRVLNGGTATSLTEVSLATGIPPLITNTQCPILMSAAYTPNSAANIAYLIPFGSSASAALGTAMVAIKAAAAAQMITAPFKMVASYDSDNSYQAIKYAVQASDALILYVNGFIDYL